MKLKNSIFSFIKTIILIFVLSMIDGYVIGPLVYGKSNKILVICNTIRKAQQLYTELKDEMSDSEKINLLHNCQTQKFL